MGGMIKKELKRLILKGEFLKAQYLVGKVTSDEFETLIFEIGCDDESICAYSFICFLLLKNETVEYHCMASGLINIAFSYMAGGYETSLYHIRRAIELDPQDKKLKETLLFFNDISEKLVSDEEASRIQAEIS